MHERKRKHDLFFLYSGSTAVCDRTCTVKFQTLARLRPHADKMDKRRGPRACFNTQSSCESQASSQSDASGGLGATDVSTGMLSKTTFPATDATAPSDATSTSHGDENKHIRPYCTTDESGSYSDDYGSPTPAQSSESDWTPEVDDAPRPAARKASHGHAHQPRPSSLTGKLPRLHAEEISNGYSSSTSDMSDDMRRKTSSNCDQLRPRLLHELHFVDADVAWYAAFPPVACLARGELMLGSNAMHASPVLEGRAAVSATRWSRSLDSLQCAMPGILEDAIKQLRKDTRAVREFKSTARSNKMIAAAARNAKPHEVYFPRRQQRKQFVQMGGRTQVVLGGTRKHACL